MTTGRINQVTTVRRHRGRPTAAVRQAEELVTVLHPLEGGRPSGRGEGPSRWKTAFRFSPQNSHRALVRYTRRPQMGRG